MAKDPAFLFYSTDFFMGTIELSDEQAGQYIRLMCLQHQKGRLSEAILRSVMHGELDPAIMAKLERDENGMYYNQRLEKEIVKRQKYSESRRTNRRSEKDMKNTAVKEESAEQVISSEGTEDMTHICKSHDAHMVNENENVNENKELKELELKKLKNHENHENNEVKEKPAGKRKKPEEKAFSPKDKAYQAAMYLDRQISARLGKRKPVGEERLQAWAREFDRCHRLDERSWDEIGQVLRFSQTDKFWSQNILSGGKFREKYLQLLAKMRVGWDTGPQGGFPDYGDKEDYL